MADIEKKSIYKRPDIKTNDLLVIGLNKDEKIVQFNKSCELATGYDRTNILQKKFSDILIPESDISRWKTLFPSLLQNSSPDKFVLPLKTMWGKSIPVLWDCFPNEDKNDQLVDICLFGKPLNTLNVQKQILPSENDFFNSPGKTMPPSTSASLAPETTEKRIVLRLKNKPMVFANKQHVRPRAKSKKIEKGFSPLRDHLVKKQNNYLFTNAVDETIDDTVQQYQTLTQRLKEVEIKDRLLEKKNKQLEKMIQYLQSLSEKGVFGRMNKLKNLVLQNSPFLKRNILSNRYQIDYVTLLV